MREFFDHEGRFFAVDDGSSGFVWKPAGWQPITADFAGKVWASGVDAEGKAAEYGAKLEDLPAA